MLTQNDLKLLNGAFGEYYRLNSKTIPVPRNISLREFGYQTLTGNWTRHISIPTSESFQQFIAETYGATSYYCSVSRYDEPSSTPMESKKWKNADFAFDIDAKDINLDCRPDHAVYVCAKCGTTSLKPGICSACNVGRKAVSLACERCVSEARKHADALIAILTDDCGMSESEITVYFSGNEGYHIHVTDQSFGLVESKGRGRLIKYLSSKGVLADAGVTTELTRIFRMPNTLSSKSGMAKIECSNPLNSDAVVLGNDNIDVSADCAVQFKLGGNKLGPYSGQATVPKYAAIYMILKGLAHAV